MQKLYNGVFTSVVVVVFSVTRNEIRVGFFAKRPRLQQAILFQRNPSCANLLGAPQRIGWPMRSCVSSAASHFVFEQQCGVNLFFCFFVFVSLFFEETHGRMREYIDRRRAKQRFSFNKPDHATRRAEWRFQRYDLQPLRAEHRQTLFSGSRARATSVRSGAVQRERAKGECVNRSNMSIESQQQLTA